MAVHPNSAANLKPAKKGEVRNPTGMTKEVRARILRTADKASRMNELLAESVEKLMQDLAAEGKYAEIAAFMRSDYNTFTRDALDRAFGKAQGSLDLTNSDETMMPTTIRLIAAAQEDDESGS